MDEIERQRIAAEIVALTLPPEPEEDEITVAQYIAAARGQGLDLTDRQARCALEAAVRDGKMTRRNIGRRVYFRIASEDL